MDVIRYQKLDEAVRERDKKNSTTNKISPNSEPVWKYDSCYDFFINDLWNVYNLINKLIITDL